MPKGACYHSLRDFAVRSTPTLGELGEFGAWKSETMIKRYAHFAPEQLRNAADRLARFWSTETKQVAARDAATC